MGKKTRIKLAGEGWDTENNPRFGTNFGTHKVGDIIEVALDKKLDGFNYKGEYFSAWTLGNHVYSIEILTDEPSEPEPEKPFEFRVGDKVRCILFGDQIFEVLGDKHDQYPLKIDVINSYIRYSFSRNGFFDEVNKIPFITLVERPKKTVKKTYWVATYLENDFIKVPAKIYSDKESGEIDLRFIRDVQFHEITREVLCE